MSSTGWPGTLQSIMYGYDSSVSSGIVDMADVYKPISCIQDPLNSGQFLLRTDIEFVADSGIDARIKGSNLTGPDTLVAGAQSATGAWVDFGPELDCDTYNTIGLWLDVTINNSTDFRARALAKHTSGGADEYVLPIETVSSSDIKIEDEYVELNDDADQKVLLKVLTDNITPYVQFQIMVGAVGAPVAATAVGVTTRGWR